jgi:cytidylate kinase
MPRIRISEGGDVAKVIEKQVRNWEIARAQSATAEQAVEREVQQFVAVSRAIGAGGLQVAERLAECLGWPLFDKEILQAMAADDRMRARLYESLDEHDENWLHSLLRWVVQGEFRADDYFHRLSETVLALARRGPVVFLGRGAGLILPRDQGLRIRIIAPAEQCVRNFAEQYDLPLDRARTTVARIGHDQASFIRHHFGRDVSDPELYDLVLNLEHLTDAEAIEIIVGTLRQRGLPA